MSANLSIRKNVGLALFAIGVAMALACHVAGSWELLRYRGQWRSVSSDTLAYDVPCYDAFPAGPEVGRVVIYGGFVASVQLYFPLAIPLLRSGYAVRLVAHSGSPNSGVPMSYESHGTEAMVAARDFLEKSEVPAFLIGHSEGTRYAVEAGREISTVDGVVLLSTVSAALDKKRPANVLILVAEDDLTNIKRQTDVALMNGTGLKRPKFGTLYGSIEQGTARLAEIMPATNHVNIFFKESSQPRILGWINQISGNEERANVIGSRLRFPALAIGVLVGSSLAVVGIGLMFPRVDVEFDKKRLPAWAFLILMVAGWAVAVVIGDSITFMRGIPLLVYGRMLVFFAIVTVPLLIVALARRGLGAGVPRGTWKARAMLFGLALTLLLFERWLVSVIPGGQRLLWFGLAALVTVFYFGCDEFLRRKIQSATDWQTGFALGLGGAFVAAVAVAVAGFFAGPPIGQFLVGGAVTLFIVMSVCEAPATYLFAATGDWALSWWVRVVIFNGFIVGIVPLVSETAFGPMTH